MNATSLMRRSRGSQGIVYRGIAVSRAWSTIVVSALRSLLLQLLCYGNAMPVSTPARHT